VVAALKGQQVRGILLASLAANVSGAGIDKAFPNQTTSRSVSALESFPRPLEPPSTQATSHLDLILPSNGYPDYFNTCVGDALPAATSIAATGSSVTASSSTSTSPPRTNLDEIIKSLENELGSRPP